MPSNSRFFRKRNVGHLRRRSMNRPQEPSRSPVDQGPFSTTTSLQATQSSQTILGDLRRAGYWGKAFASYSRALGIVAPVGFPRPDINGGF